MIKNILFDFDGTLADTSQVLLKTYPVIAKKYGLHIPSVEEIEQLRQYPIRVRMKKMGIPFYYAPRILNDARSACLEYMDTCPHFTGVKELLADLSREGLVIGILSSNSAENIRRFLRTNDLGRFDMVYVTRSLFRKHKAINQIISRHNLKKEETLYVGDELRDIVACKRVPVKIIAVTWGYDSLSLLKKGHPDYIADRPAEILTIVQDIRGSQ